jgi:hypothetical protein
VLGRTTATRAREAPGPDVGWLIQHRARVGTTRKRRSRLCRCGGCPLAGFLQVGGTRGATHAVGIRDGWRGGTRRSGLPAARIGASSDGEFRDADEGLTIIKNGQVWRDLDVVAIFF